MDKSPAPETLLIAAPVAPMHRSPSRRSEQVSQALLGDPAVVLDRRSGWRRIRTLDGYEGWVTARRVAAAPPGWQAPFCEVQPLWANLRPAPHYRAPAWLTAFAGTRLPLSEQKPGWLGLLLPAGATAWTEAHRVRSAECGQTTDDGRRTTDGSSSVYRLSSAVPNPQSAFPSPLAVLRTAERFLGIPYLWGGCTPVGIDCSGFVQLVWRLQGAQLPRDAWQQAECGRPVPLDVLEAADLVFFGPEEGGTDRIAHVGLCLDSERMIHAAGSDQVRVNHLSDSPYAERLLFARRLIGHSPE
jgi:cell wall-associated NlpC family hydrolase